MEALRAYLATLTPIEQSAYAKRAGTTIGYLRKVLCTKEKLGGVISRRLDEESDGAVPRSVLRPDIWPPAKPVRKNRVA